MKQTLTQNTKTGIKTHEFLKSEGMLFPRFSNVSDLEINESLCNCGSLIIHSKIECNGGIQ